MDAAKIRARQRELKNIGSDLQRMKDRCVSESRNATEHELQIAGEKITRVDEIKKEFQTMNRNIALQAVNNIASRLEREGGIATEQERQIIDDCKEYLEPGDMPEIFSRSQGRPYYADPQDTGGSYRPTASPITGGLRGPGDPKNYVSLYGKQLDRENFSNSNEFFRVASSGRYDPRLRAGITESGPPSEGGFAVPTEFSREIHDVALEDEIVFPRCRVQPMTSNSILLPAFDIGSHASHLYGGLVGYWKPEATELTQSQPKFRQMELNVKKLTIFFRFSSEWQEDSGGEGTVARIAGKGLGWYRDLSLLKGSGASEPQGVLNSPALIVVSAEEGQSASIVYENLANMLARLHPNCWRNSIWVAHPTTIPTLLTLGITVGLRGAFYPVLQENSGQFSMLGRPCIFSEKMEPVGNQGDILLADFSQYICGLRRDISYATSPAPFFSSDEWAARLICRLDGQSLWNSQLTLEDGLTTLSPFIVLEARS